MLYNNRGLGNTPPVQSAPATGQRCDTATEREEKMDEIKNYVMGYYKAAYFGCLDWCHDEHSVMYDEYCNERRAYGKMLLDMGYTFPDLLNLDSQLADEYVKERV